MTGSASAPEARRLDSAGPLVLLGSLFLLVIGLQSASRLLLALEFQERVRVEPQFARLFLLGVRLDVMVACYTLAPLALALLVCPRFLLVRLRWPLVVYCAVAVGLVVALEAVSSEYLGEYDVRPDRLFVESLGGSREILATVWRTRATSVCVALAATVSGALGAGWIAARTLPCALRWPSPRRLALLFPVAPALFLGMRGTLQHRPINASTVAFSGQNLVNQLALNSAYTTLRACYDLRHERPPSALYGRMDEREMLARVARVSGLPAPDPGEPVPFLHQQRANEPRSRPRNLVIVIEESLGAEFVGCLGGLPLTPRLDELAKEGLLLTRLYSTGTRTVRGLEAVVSGFLPTPGDSVVKLGKAQSGFFTLASLLARRGYATEFVYGGETHFDNMAAFFLGNGFQRVVGAAELPEPQFRGTWGISDEDLMRGANELFASHGDQPFLAVVLSTSNHSPFEFPDGRIELHDAEKATRNNTVKYADYALGELFQLARQEAYWDDTVWLVVADHDERTYGPDLVPVEKFHIPGLLIAPGLAPGTYDAVASQIDLAPTALGLLGLTLEHPLVGRDLRALPPDDPGRAILQFHDNHALLVGDRLAVHPGSGAAQCFRVVDGRLQSAPHDLELERDGLAHALLPGWLYETRRYRLPDASGHAAPRGLALVH